jgi:hypothetical protein
MNSSEHLELQSQRDAVNRIWIRGLIAVMQIRARCACAIIKITKTGVIKWLLQSRHLLVELKLA